MNKEYILKNTLPGSNAKYSDSRILFAKFDMSGLDDFHEYSTHSEFFRYLEFNPHNKLSDSIEYINKVRDRISNGYQGGHAMYWFLKLRETKKVVGSMAIVGIDFNTGIGWIGKGLSPVYWGKGYMSEAMDMYLDFCRNALDLKEINSLTRHDNSPNIRLMKKHGFNIVRELKSYYKDSSGVFHNAVLMSLTL